MRILLDQGASGASVIEMDVGEEDGVEIGHAEAMKSQLFAQDGKRGGRAGVNQGAEAVGKEECCGDGTGVAAPEKVEGQDASHK
jgi:hypothetical protein